MSEHAQPRRWFEEYPDRFEDESRILATHGFILDRDELRKGIVQFRGNAKHDGRPLLVRFPEGFPSFAPRISDTPESPILFRHHNPYTRDFCLFGPGSIRWSAAESADSALHEVDDLLVKFSSGSSVESDTAPEPLSAALQYLPGSAVLVPGEIVEVVSANERFSYSDRFSMLLDRVDAERSRGESQIRGFIKGVEFAGSSVTVQRPSPLRKSSEVQGYVFTFTDHLDSQSIITALNECRKAVNPQNRSKEFWLALVFPEQSVRRTGSRFVWVIARLSQTGEFSFIRTFQESGDSRTSRIPGYESLSGKKVAIVGCGCLGSKIASALAATGVEKFVLIDWDVFEPANSVRHECGTEAFGLAKCQALAGRLASLNPRVFRVQQVLLGPIRLGATLDPAEHDKVLSAMLACDLIVESAGSHSVSRYVNELAYKSGIPAVYASVNDGASSGEIVTVEPNEDTACWMCWCHEYYNQKPPAPSGVARDVFHPGCDQPSFTGTTFETGIIAQMAAWKCADILLKAKVARKFIDQPYLLWIGRGADGTPVLRWDRLPITKRGTCAICASHTAV